jgi:Ni,Fe-hydrogenase I large subunit
VHNGAKWDPNTWPASTQGYGYTEAPRGALGHWVKIDNKQISNYQQVVPTTWNGSPRDAAGVPGAWETALIGTPIADMARPVEVLRTVHSFDPCMACAVHIIDVNKGESTRVEFY